jgi:hypothetical protein
VDSEVAEVLQEGQGFLDWAINRIGLSTKLEMFEFIVIVFLLVIILALARRRNGRG